MINIKNLYGRYSGYAYALSFGISFLWMLRSIGACAKACRVAVDNKLENKRVLTVIPLHSE